MKSEVFFDLQRSPQAARQVGDNCFPSQHPASSPHWPRPGRCGSWAQPPQERSHGDHATQPVPQEAAHPTARTSAASLRTVREAEGLHRGATLWGSKRRHGVTYSLRHETLRSTRPVHNLYETVLCASIRRKQICPNRIFSDLGQDSENQEQFNLRIRSSF